MTLGEVANVITALAALLAAYTAYRTSRKVDRNTVQIKEVHDATNGMKTDLVEAVRKGSLATGKAEGLAQGRAEDRHTR